MTVEVQTTSASTRTSGASDVLVADLSALFESWRELVFRCEGSQPLLMHCAVGNLGGPSTGATKRKEIPTPEEEAKKGEYRNAAGNLYIPAIMMRACLLGAASRFTVEKKRFSLKVPMAGAVQIDPDWVGFELTDANGVPLTTYEIDTQRAVVNRAGISRSRPRIDPPWYVECHYTVDLSSITLQDLERVLVTAGKMQGIGDYRPSKGGPYGTFRILSLEVR